MLSFFDLKCFYKNKSNKKHVDGRRLHGSAAADKHPQTAKAAEQRKRERGRLVTGRDVTWRDRHFPAARSRHVISHEPWFFFFHFNLLYFILPFQAPRQSQWLTFPPSLLPSLSFQTLLFQSLKARLRLISGPPGDQPPPSDGRRGCQLRGGGGKKRRKKRKKYLKMEAIKLWNV